MRRILILLGPPGVGKGTVAKSLVHLPGFQWLSSGELLRQAKRSGSEFGNRIAGFIDVGELVPDELIIQRMEDEIATLPQDCAIMLDGFPRTLAQAEALDEMLERLGGQVSEVFELRAEVEEIERRVLKRRQDEDRADDTWATLQHRFRIFHDQTAPLVGFYASQEKLRVIDGMGTPQEVVDQLIPCIQHYLSREPFSNQKEAR